jgi:lysophospholipase L1-like esterase
MPARHRFLVMLVCLVAGLAGATTANAARRAPLYVALGDSLSRGAQPTADGFTETSEGYPDRLLAQMPADYDGVKLLKLGCSGELTSTMLAGGICSYEERRRIAANGAVGTQLDAAEAFLRRYESRVRLVTVDIGLNDIGGCVKGSRVDAACVQRAVAAVTANGRQIAQRLRAAAPAATLVFVEAYDPFPAPRPFWPQTKVSVTPPVTQVNQALAQSFLEVGGRIAHVQDAVPASRLCELTFMCAAKPDLHARPAGYDVIAQTIAAALA